MLVERIRDIVERENRGFDGSLVITFAVMRNLKRNQISVEYSLYLGNAELTDDNGCATGEFAPKYGDKTALMISVSSNKGDYSQQQFGNLLDYDPAR